MAIRRTASGGAGRGSAARASGRPGVDEAAARWHVHGDVSSRRAPRGFADAAGAADSGVGAHSGLIGKVAAPRDPYAPATHWRACSGAARPDARTHALAPNSRGSLERAPPLRLRYRVRACRNGGARRARRLATRCSGGGIRRAHLRGRAAKACTSSIAGRPGSWRAESSTHTRTPFRFLRLNDRSGFGVKDCARWMPEVAEGRWSAGTRRSSSQRTGSERGRVGCAVQRGGVRGANFARSRVRPTRSPTRSPRRSPSACSSAARASAASRWRTACSTRTTRRRCRSSTPCSSGPPSSSASAARSSWRRTRCRTSARSTSRCTTRSRRR